MHLYSFVKIPIYLERGRKLLVCSRFKVTSIGIAPYLPWGGRKLCFKALHWLPDICIDTYLPREGSETLHKKLPLKLPSLYSYLSTSRGDGNHSSNNSSSNIFLYSYLSTSKGAGNHSTSSISIPGQSKYSYLSTSRGDENPRILSAVPVFGSVCIDTYLPR